MANLEALENSLDASTLDDKPLSAPVHGCRDMLCGFGATCEVDKRNASRGLCRCAARSCAGLVAPVCGSDHATYSSECELENAMCSMQRRVKVMGRGPCGAKDPCEGVRCGFGSVCVASAGRQRARCLCPTACPPPSSSASAPGTVCGSDGRDYPSECELNRQVCGAGKNVYKVFDGPCDPCRATRRLADAGRLCRVEPGTLRAVVNPDPALCPPGRGPVCGDDGAAYPSECALVRTAALRGVTLSKLHDGACTPADQCKEKCQFNAECSVRNGVARCSCERLLCEGRWAPVCAGAQRTFANDCERKKAECLERQNLPTLAKGPCATRVFAGVLVLATPLGGDAPTFTQETSEQLAEMRSSAETALYNLLASSDVKDDFKTLQVKLIEENRITVEMHFDPQTRFSPPDVERALVKQLKSSRRKPIDVKRPEENNIKIVEYGTRLGSSKSITATAALGPCDQNPCLHGGTCHADGDDFFCCCPLGRGGAVCEREIGFFEPSFGGRSFVALGLGSVRLSRETRLSLGFRASGSDGLLLYGGQASGRDFVSLALVSRHVEFRFNAGSGPAVLTSQREVKPGVWHQVWVERTRRSAALSVDKEPPVTGTSPGSLDSLNLDSDLYLAGAPSDLMPRIVEQTTATAGLTGCINHLSLNDVKFSLSWPPGRGLTGGLAAGPGVLYGACVGECGSNPCRPDPCRNGGTCVAREAEAFRCTCAAGFTGATCADSHRPCEPNPCKGGSKCLVLPDGGYKCECPFQRAGANCEREVAMISSGAPFIPSFNGLTSYMETKSLDMLTPNAKNQVTVEVVFLTRQPDGMIFYNGQKSDGRGDFISLAITKGSLEFRYDLGKGAAIMRSVKPLTLNIWHTVTASRTGRKGFMKINAGSEILGEAPKSRKGNHLSLDLREALFLGGVPDYSRIARAAAITSGLDGAIQKFTVSGSDVRLDAVSSRLSLDVVPFRDHPCTSGKNPCRSGGTCVPLLSTYECSCPRGFSGKTCQTAPTDRVALDEAVSFNGKTFIEYQSNNGKSHMMNEVPDPGFTDYAADQSDKAQQTNYFEMSVRTDATQGLILWAGKGTDRADFLAIAIVDGYVQMTYDLGSRPVTLTSTIMVNTNKWVRIKAVRNQREGSLQVDNEAAVMGSSPFEATQLDTDGTLWLGGMEKPSYNSRLPKAYSTGFVGCMRDVVVDRKELRIEEDAVNKPRVSHCAGK